MSNDYLEHYERSLLQAPGWGPAGWLRRLLDRRARALGQADRHALFLPRVLALAGLNETARPLDVLEVGCGSGWALSYRSPGVRYWAVDRGDRFKAELEARGIAFHQLDVGAEALPFADGAFDLVLLNHVIEHVAAGDFLAAELARVLRPRAHLYVRTPNVERLGARFHDDPTHVAPYTPAALTEHLGSHGFAPVVLFHSDHPRITLDILSGGRLRALLMSARLGGKEIEALFVKR